MLGKEVVLDRAVAASRPFEADDITPVVVEGDILGRQGCEDDQRTAAILLLGALDDRAAENPFGVMDAAVETPAAVESVAALFAHSAAGREERYRGSREVAVGEDLIEPG